MTLYCPQCLDVMKPLFNSYFCPNDCDRRSKMKGCSLGWNKIASKMPMHLVSQFEQIAAKRSKLQIFKEHEGPWGCSATPRTLHETRLLDVLIDINGERVTVIKNRYGSYDIDGLKFE